MSEDLLVTWKEIAAYLKCSVRKAQRLEGLLLPVKRIPNTKAVWASKTEIDEWLNRQSAKAEAETSRATQGAHFRFPGQIWILATVFMMTAVAAMSSAYALTIVLFVIETTLLAVTYPRLPDTVYTRAFVGIFLIAGLSYTIAATSLPAVLSGAVNMTTLPPAFAYPFVVGLRFIPIPILICGMLIVGKLGILAAFDRNRHVRVAYVIAGAVLIGATAIVGFPEMRRIWRADLSIRWTLLAGEFFICAVNSALLALGYSFFQSPRVRGYCAFMSRCGIACVLIALTAAINTRHWTEISHSSLDILNPVIYKVGNDSAASDFRTWLENHDSEAGEDLVALSNDPEFLYALENKQFYKQSFDEAFQGSHRAVIFGFRDIPNSSLRQPRFVLIRFPAELATILRFQRIP